MLGFLGVAVVGTVAAQAAGITSLQDLQGMGQEGHPIAQALRTRFAGLRERVQASDACVPHAQHNGPLLKSWCQQDMGQS